jgi:NADPH:quinone reductase
LPIPTSMRFVDASTPGGPEVLKIGMQPVPRPGPQEVLVRVKAAGMNRADLMQRAGKYPPPPGASPILGMEVAGTIAALGAEPTGRWREGDAVCALLAGGGDAEYVAVPAGQCMPIPKGLTLIEAAAIPETALTVWANLFATHRLSAGDRLLVQGGSSGVGAMAIQIARNFGARVAATAGSQEKCAFCLTMGAEKAVNYHDDWLAELTSWARPSGIDVILDMVGGNYFPKHLALLAMEGRLVQIATIDGSQVTADLGAVMNKRLVITGSTLRRRTVEQKSVLARAVEEHLWPLFEDRRLRPTVFRVFPMESVVEAHRFMEAGSHMGKIVLEMV